jgi:hypothetical protein
MSTTTLNPTLGHCCRSVGLREAYVGEKVGKETTTTTTKQAKGDVQMSFF